MNPWSARNHAQRDAAKAWGIVDEKNQTIAEQRDTIADLEHQLASANSLIARMNDRADKLLAKVYELRANLPARPHTECVDKWADGDEPCVDCLVLLGVRT